MIFDLQGKHAKFKKYVGHSAHVTNVRWTSDDGRLISVGGADTSVMVWSHARAHESEDTGGDSDDSDTDSEEEGGYDSDVEKEKNLTYEDKIYANPIRTTKGVKPHLRDRQEDEEHRYMIIVNLGWGGVGRGEGTGITSLVRHFCQRLSWLLQYGGVGVLLILRDGGFCNHFLEIFPMPNLLVNAVVSAEARFFGTGTKS